MKKLLVIAFTALCAASSQAAYLYWQVDSSKASTYEAQFANLYSGETLIGSAKVGTVTATDIGSYTSFYIELYNYSSEKVATGNEWSYTELANQGAITDTLVSIPQAWTGGTFTAYNPGGGGGEGGGSVPEPTSGLLMLIGMAALSLKRRKV